MSDRKVVINLDPTSGEITKGVNGIGTVIITLADAREHWERLEIKDCNLAFSRLADNEFNLPQTLKFYRDDAEENKHGGQ